MKKFILYIMMVSFALWSLSSCNQEVIQDNGYGYLGLSLDSDLSEDAMTKAGDELVFSIDVFNASGQKVASRDDHRTITNDDPIKLQVGSYSAEARSGEDLNAAFDNPYYEGRSAKNFKINPGRTTTESLTCTLANTIVSVEFPGDFSRFTDYEVAVTNGTGDKLVFSNKPQSGNNLEAGFDAKAYFAVTGELTWELYLKNTDGGEYRATETYTDVKARQHYHLKFAMGEDTGADGAFILKIGLENSWDESVHEITLDFSKKNMPDVLTNEEFAAVSGESVPVPVGNMTEKAISFSAAEGVRSLFVAHDNQVMADKGLPETVEFVGAPQTLMSSLNSVGFVVTDVITRAIDGNSKNVNVNLTGFIASLPVGRYEIDFTFIDTKGRYEVFELVFEIISDVDAEAVAAKTGWAAFAQLEGRFFDVAKKDVLAFQYRKAADSKWTDVPHSDIDVNTVSLRFSTVLYGLEPSTEYVFRAVSDEDIETREVSFTTSSMMTLPNLSFDNWTNDDKYPNAAGSNVWDSANSSGAAVTTSPTTDAVKGKAAKLESVSALGMMAAGNIFTGAFGGLDGLGAELNWGTPFDSRPLALKGYFKYSPVTINKVKDPYKDMKGKMDQCQILVFLADWDSPFVVNTNKKQFVDLDNDPGIIALGVLNTDESSSGYVGFTLPLVYRDNTRMPKYIVVAGASSRFGDYFTGGIGSTLYLDEFQFVYDPAELTDDEFNTVFSKVSPF